MFEITTLPTRFIGCDVGKHSIVVFDSANKQLSTVPNTQDALTRFAMGLDATSCLVVCEATGGYERSLLDAMIMAHVPAHRADARKVKAFIRSFGILSKTDAIDARALAQYGEERHSRLLRWQARDENRDKLQAMVNLRRDLVTQRTAFNNRLQAPGSDAVQSHIKAVLDCLDSQIKAINTDVDAIMKANEQLDQMVNTLKTIVGIGQTTASALIALMPELGRIDRTHAAALAGLAPHPHQSGTLDAHRRVKGGRPEIKRVLFMAALTASQHNPALRTFYQRLIANGKLPIVAVTAVMRKLVVIANAKLRELLINTTQKPAAI